MSLKKEKNLSELLDLWSSGATLTDEELAKLYKDSRELMELLEKSGYLFKLQLGAMRSYMAPIALAAAYKGIL